MCSNSQGHRGVDAWQSLTPELSLTLPASRAKKLEPRIELQQAAA